NNWDDDFEYLALVFISSSQVEAWSKLVEDETETKDDNGSYSISGNNITIEFDYLSLTATIDGNSMSVTGDGDTYYYSKQ
ncbi:MAG: hypothetical protein GQ527_06790, partial [Bacteroidales bacterium]|nr:hypothetical protein [Bacteroidales bacterium]